MSSGSRIRARVSSPSRRWASSATELCQFDFHGVVAGDHPGQFQGVTHVAFERFPGFNGNLVLVKLAHVILGRAGVIPEAGFGGLGFHLADLAANRLEIQVLASLLDTGAHPFELRSDFFGFEGQNRLL